MDDYISRRVAIKTVNKIRDACDTESLDDYRDLLVECFKVMPSAQPSFPQAHENDCISREEAIKALGEEPEVWSGKDEYAQGLNNQWHYDVNALKAVPPTQPEQLERCPIYGGVCGYPSDQCYECPRHSGAQPEQLIRCGDCKYKDDGIDEDGFPFLKCLHGRSYGGTRINDFCSWAERKEGEAE